MVESRIHINLNKDNSGEEKGAEGGNTQTIVYNKEHSQ